MLPLAPSSSSMVLVDPEPPAVTRRAWAPGAHLDPDRAAADHHHSAGYVGEGGGLPVGPNPGVLETANRRAGRLGAGGHGHPVGVEDLAVDLDPAGSDQAGRCLDDRCSLLAVAVDLAELSR